MKTGLGVFACLSAVATNSISLAAERLSGVRYALQTLRQLAVAGRRRASA